MTYSLVIKPEAELDILNSVKWYEEKQAQLGLRFLEAVELKIKSIINNPLLYQVRYKNTRLALTKTFPYAIHLF